MSSNGLSAYVSACALRARVSTMPRKVTPKNRGGPLLSSFFLHIAAVFLENSAHGAEILKKIMKTFGGYQKM
jgi:hypothetical protein